MNEFYLPASKTIVSEDALRALFPRVSFPAVLGADDLARMGAAVVFATPAPQISATQRVTRNGVVPDGAGNWVYAWKVENLSAAEIAAQIVQARADKTAAATAERWNREQGGLTLPSGAQIATTTADQNRIVSILSTANLLNLTAVNFKAETGWITLQVADVKAIAVVVGMHVQACFSAERVHHEAIAALPADLAAIRAYDLSKGWPSAVVTDPVPPVQGLVIQSASGAAFRLDVDNAGVPTTTPA